MIKTLSRWWSQGALFALLGAAACGGGEATEPTRSISSRARLYLNELIGHMQAYSINRLRIDWNEFRDTVFATAADAETIPDTYPAIRLAIELLDDGHTYFETTTGTRITLPKKTCQPSGATQPALPPTIGYVKVNGFRGLGDPATAFANDLQRAIIAADRDDLIGWIVDVRGNGGGNMWPMVAGVGPILGESTIGYFIEPTGAEEMWEYRDGTALLNGTVMQHIEPYRLRREQPRVAVLMDNG